MLEQERARLLKALKHELQTTGPVKLAVFGDFLERNNFSRTLYAGMGPKRWLEANFPELTIVPENGRDYLVFKNSDPKLLPPSPTPVPQAELNEEIRRKMVSVLSEHLETHGMILHSAIPGVIPEWTRYRNGNERLGIWLSRIFRENEFTTRPVNNAAALFLPQTAADIDRIVKAVNEMIQSTGRASLAAVASRLSMEDLRWESLPVAHNQTLEEWLVDYCPRIAYSASTDSVYLAQFVPGISTPSITDINKQNVVYQYAFLPSVGPTLTSLRELLQDPNYSNNAWKKLSVDTFYDNLVGLGEGFLYDSETSRFAFNTGLMTPATQHIYCVIIPNDMDSAIQPWRCAGFCYPGQDDPEGYGKWLCQKFGLDSENQDMMTLAYAGIETALQEISALQASLLPRMAEAENCIRLGNPVDNDFAGELARYMASWQSIQTAVGSLSISIPAEGITMDHVQEILNRKDSISAVLDDMREDYLELVHGAWSYMENTAHALCGDAATESDIARWDEKMAQIQMTEDSIHAAVLELLLPFRAMRTLVHCSRPLTEEQRQAVASLESHFDAMLLPKMISNFFSEANDEQVAFLNRIDSIEKRRKQIRINSGAVIHVETTGLDDRELSHQILADGNIHTIYSHYPALNEFERSIVSGDHSQAQNIAQDSERMTALGYSPEQQATINLEIDKLSNNFATPILTAGINLERLQGNTNRQAEKYLLLATVLKDGSAANPLADLLARENRAELLWEVYTAHSHNFPAEIRQQYLPMLIDAGYLTIPEVIRSDLLGFLAIQTADTMDRFFRSGQLSEAEAEHLKKIRLAIQEPFIRQVTFMDAELYRFIQQQENIDRIQTLGIHQTQESLGELLKIGNFPRGQDIISVAQRLWHFIGDWNAAAESVILLAENCPQKTDMLWNIYQFRRDQQQMLRLLRQEPALQVRFREIYSDLLFHSGAYQEYYDAFAEVPDPSVRMQLQFAVCAIRTGQCDSRPLNIQNPADLAGAVDAILLLTRSMAENGMISQLGDFLDTYFEPIMVHCGTDTIKRVVTAEGTLDENAILQLQNHAIANGNTALAMFCSGFLKNRDDQYYDEAYYNRLWDSVYSASPEEQAQSIRKIQLLFPDQYRRNYVRIFPYLLRSTFLVGSKAPEETILSVAQMLTPDCVSDSTIDQILNIIAEYGGIAHPLIQSKIMQLCQTPEYQEICLRVFHAHRDEYEGKLDRALCLLYQIALEASAMPPEFLTEAEAVCLRQLCSHQDPVAARCLSIIEEKLGRDPFRQFVALHLQRLEDGETSEYEDLTTELSIFRQVLEDPSCSIDDYLQFCSSFGLFSEQDRQVVESLLDPDLEGALTEAESIPMLHGFYENRSNNLYLTAIRRLPLHDNPEVYARLLFYCEKNSPNRDDFMQTCATYCQKFQLDDILIDALAEMIRKVNRTSVATPRWYDAKGPFATARSLYTMPDSFRGTAKPESIRELLNEMCMFFRRIDANSATSEHHTSLRTIVELAVVTHNEDMVVEKLMDKLLGIYRKLGLVFAIHLLRRGSYDSALQQLQALSRGYNQDVYPQLVAQLSRMSCEALEDWARKEDSRMLMEYFILPDGNRPDIQTLACFTMNCICNKKYESGILVAEELTRHFEKDGICHKVQFVLCKENYPEYLPQIQRSLIGMYLTYGVDRRHFHTRSPEDLLTLLTILTAVMQQQEVPSMIDSISDFIHGNTVYNDQTMSRIVADQTSLYEKIRSQFIGISEYKRDLLVHSLLGCVTGNWAIFADLAFQERISSEELAVYLKNGLYSRWGMTRGLLRVAFDLPTEKRAEFLQWIQSSEELLGKANYPIKSSLKNAILILNQNKNPDVAREALQLPWEEHFICLGVRDANALDSCYAWMWNYLQKLSSGPAVTDVLDLYYQLAQDNYKLSRLYQDAENAFRQGDFVTAAKVFDFFEKRRYLCHVPPNKALDSATQSRIQGRWRETYEARSRVSKVLLGDPETILKFQNMKSHSCINIAISLLHTPHIGELPRIMPYFRESNRKLIRALLTIVDPAKTDAEKLEVYDSFDPGATEQRLLARILSSRDRFSYLFLQDQERAREIGITLTSLSDNMRFIVNRMLVLNSRLPEESLKQIRTLRLDVQEEHDHSDDLSAFDFDVLPDEDFVPAFVLQGISAEQDEELPTLETLRQEYARCPYDNYAEKLRLARGIYFRISMETPGDANALSAALLQYGQEYRSYHQSLLSDADSMSEEEKLHSRIQIRQSLLDMAYYTVLSRSEADAIPLIRSADGLHAILSNDFDSIDELMGDYRKNRGGYQALARYIDDTQIRDITGKVFREIQRLEQHYNTAGPRDQNTSSYREAYKAAYDALEKLPFHLNWNQVKNTLLKLLMRAINDLDKRPFLDVKILNNPVATRSEFITGTLSNTGRVPAEAISIQAIFENNKVSDIYGIRELFPNEMICFAVPFTAPEDAQTWSYKLNITYRHRDKEYTMDPFTGTLQLTENNILPTDVDLYGAHKKMIFSTDEEGRIVGKGFYGRVAQIESLKRLAPEGADFSEYSRAIVQGFRRTGKTSLLHYFEAYLNSKCADQAIPIYVDCEGFASQPVQKAFVNAILHGVEFQMPHLTERESWIRLKNTWMLPEDAGDRNPDSLQFFYQALGRELDGKGIVLILDEIDRLFGRLEETQGTASSLFPSLRAVQNNPACIASVCMILCGSNNMLIYNQNMGQVYQLFQDFPKITVGRLNREDIQNILNEPLEENSLIAYHPDAIEWIWRYTGGLVWYAKLLGNAAVRRVKEAGRKYIYPIDISHALDNVVQGKDTKQYIDEGCTEEAKLVLDAMAALSIRYGADITLNQLMAQLGGALNELQLDSTLALLTDTLGLLERSSSIRNAYHFAVEIYRRIYRSLDSYVYKRMEGPLDRTTITDLMSEDTGARKRRGIKK